MDKKVLYILGAGRSGTTIVSILIGNASQFFLAGELNRFLKYGGIPQGRCEEDIVAKFWRKIRNEISIEDYPELHEIAQSYEYHTGILKKNILSKKLNVYRQFNDQLIQTIYRAINEPNIIDSSKYPLRAYHLLKATNHIKYCIYVKRHPVSIVRSCAKKGLEQSYLPWYLTNIYLMTIHMYCSWIKKMMIKRGVKFIEVNYNLLTHNPLRYIKYISNEFNLDFKSLEKKILSNEPLDTGYQFDGNRIRLDKNVQILPEREPINWTFGEKIVYFCNRFWWK